MRFAELVANLGAERLLGTGGGGGVEYAVPLYALDAIRARAAAAEVWAQEQDGRVLVKFAVEEGTGIVTAGRDARGDLCDVRLYLFVRSG
jgi:hypothetical protein